MNLAASVRELVSAALDPANRPVRLSFGPNQRALEQSLALHRVDITEGFMTGLYGLLTCVSSDANLADKKILGRPVSVQIVTDRGQLQTISGIVTKIRPGQSDGSLTCFQLTIQDALSVMEKRRNSRIFRNKTLPEILRVLLSEWRQRSPALARAFEFDLSGLNGGRYPSRQVTVQSNETDRKFIDRLLRRDGVTMYVKSGPAKSDDRPRSAQDDNPVHTLVFCDDPMRLSQSTAGTVRYHPRDAATELRDSITYWSWMFELVAGRVRRTSWDYKRGEVHEVDDASSLDQGEAGNDIARLLSDDVIDVPHAYDSWDHYEQIGRDRMLAHELRAERIDAMSGVRDLGVGQWFEVENHPVVDLRRPNERQFVVTSIHHRASNNLPKELNDRVLALFEASRPLFEDTPAASTDIRQGETRYENTFSCVRRGVPLTPAYDPSVDLPPTYLITGVVVGPQGEEIFIDDLGRVRVQIQGLKSDDHTHAQGVGTNGDGTDSAPVRVACALAGASFGANIPLRIGMEVLIGSIGGDPDKMIIIGVLSSGKNPPATFSHTGALPGNKYLSGFKSKEVKGQRYGQLRFDDTPQQISVQLASEHSAAQANFGFLTQPRANGQGEARGEGAELRTDADLAIRSGRAMLISAWQQLNASGAHLARDEYVQLMQECVDLFKSLGDYAAQHQGIAMDTQPHEALAATVKSWQNGAASGPSSAPQAAIGITAPEGISVATPKTVATYAGRNIDTVAQYHLQYTAGQRLNLQAGRGVSIFAQSNGLSAIANQGKVLIQSQADDTQIDSAKNVHVTAASGKIVGMASEQITFTTSGGAYLKIDGANIELGCPGSFIVKSASHTWAGPASMSTDMPKFDQGTLGRVPTLVRPTDGQGVQGVQAEITKASGELVKGQSSATGDLAPIQGNQFEQLAVQFFKNKI
ncbi:type VI secretion system Vgr family protein [Burkholderia alba]|uniref:type VI secretion system Vgr family protein n=1 Tax=Burkholderia alba TaxID=2683677 RepID=UPI002B05BAB2|nr:type VI secretion system tip protein VgrG [Burkholderia alba]